MELCPVLIRERKWVLNQPPLDLDSHDPQKSNPTPKEYKVDRPESQGVRLQETGGHILSDPDWDIFLTEPNIDSWNKK